MEPARVEVVGVKLLVPTLRQCQKTDGCWTRYYSTLDLLSQASGAQLSGLVDPWGRPYLIDENEGEGSPTNCTRDTIAVYKLPFTTGFGVHSWTPANSVPLTGYTGC